MIALSRWKVIAVLAATIFGIVFTLPNLLPADVLAKVPPAFQKKLNLGLDLQGGSQLMYEIDVAALRDARLTDLQEEVRVRLSENQIGFDQLARVGGGVELRINEPGQVNEAVNLMRGSVGGTLASGVSDVAITTQADQRVRLAFVPQAQAEEVARAVEQSIEVIRRRIDATGTKEPSITRQGADRIVIQAPGESDPERLKDLIGQTAALTFQMVDEATPASEIAAGRIPPGTQVLETTPESGYGGQPLLLKRQVLVKGDDLTSASQGYDPQGGAPVVSFRFGGAGARKFADATANNIGKRFAIVLDNKIISAPTIQGAITGGSGQITGVGTAAEAADLALLMRSGALPAKLNVMEQRTVGAELGQDSINAGVISLSIGAVLILLFIASAYGLFGVFAGAALIVNVLLILAIMSITGATLTFPGIAGLILTLAVAVDANVLIYERIRDEAHEGRAVLSAIDHGYARALVSILDANITSGISAVIMLFLGEGPIKGFAWTLLIGVITSVFTAVVITQVLIALWFRAKRPKTLPIA